MITSLIFAIFLIKKRDFYLFIFWFEASKFADRQRDFQSPKRANIYREERKTNLNLHRKVIVEYGKSDFATTKRNADRIINANFRSQKSAARLKQCFRSLQLSISFYN